MKMMRKRMLIVFMIIAMLANSAIAFAAVPNAAHWGAGYVKAMLDKGYVTGYPDGSFGEDRHITRAEFAHMLNNILKEDRRYDNVFSDVKPTDWFYADIQKGLALGFIVPAKTFEPNRPITRIEAIEMLGFSKRAIDEQRFVDTVQLTQLQKELISFFTSKGVISGYGDNTFRPSNPITRAEACVLIVLLEKNLPEHFAEELEKQKLVIDPIYPIEPIETPANSLVVEKGKLGVEPGNSDTKPEVKKANKDALNTAITNAKAKAAETDKYTADSIAVLNTAIAEAEKVAKNDNATQKEVDDAKTALEAVVAKLVEIEKSDVTLYRLGTEDKYSLTLVGTDGKRYEIIFGKDDFGNTASVKAPYGTYTIEASEGYFATPAEWVLNSKKIGGDLYVYKKATLDIKTLGYDGAPLNFKIEYNEYNMQGMPLTLEFKPDCIPMVDGLKVSIVGNEYAEKYTVDSTTKEVNVTNIVTEIIFKFTKKQAVEIESVDEVADIEVEYGTAIEKVSEKLPKTLSIKLVGKVEKQSVAVAWRCDNYDAEKPAKYIFNAIYNVDGVGDVPSVSVNVTVKEKSSVADKSALEELIKQAKKVEKYKFSIDTVENLETAISDAQKTVEKTDASSEEITNAINKLRAAMDALNPLNTRKVELLMCVPYNFVGGDTFTLLVTDIYGVEHRLQPANSYDYYGMAYVKKITLPEGRYIIKALNDEYFVYEPNLVVGTGNIKKDIYVFQRAKLNIVNHDYNSNVEAKYSITATCFGSDYSQKTLTFDKSLVPRGTSLKVTLTSFDKDNYIVEEATKTVKIPEQTGSEVVGFNFIKLKNIVKLETFDKKMVSAKLTKVEVLKLLPKSGKLMLDDGSERVVDITWDIPNFIENVAGIAIAKGTFTTPKDVRATAKSFIITVGREGEDSKFTVLESVQSFDGIEVDYNTSVEKLRELLPKKISVKTNKSATAFEVDANWLIEESGYVPTVSDTYTIKAKYTVPYLVPGGYFDVTISVKLNPEEKAYEEADFTFTKSDGKVKVTGLTATGKAKLNTSKKLVIPSEWNGEKVTVLGSTAFQRLDIEKVVIPGTIELIEMKALGYNSISEIIIPDSVKVIRAGAFAGKSDSAGILKRVTMSKNVEEIGDYAFGWAGFTEIEVPTALVKLHAEAFYKSAGHPETKRIHVFVDGLKNPNKLSDSNLHIINPAKVAIEYRYKGEVIEKVAPTYKNGSGFFHINEATTITPNFVNSEYELKSNSITFTPDEKEYTCVIEVIKKGDKVVAASVNHAIKDVEVEYNTSKEALLKLLPTTVTLVDNKGKTHILPITWALLSYDGTVAADYTIRASWSLPEGIEQNTASPVELEKQIKVKVKPKTVVRDTISVEFSFDGHVGVPELVAKGADGTEYKFFKKEFLYAASVPRGTYDVFVKNIAEGWVSFPPKITVDSKQNTPLIMNLLKGVLLNVKAVDASGAIVPGVKFKSIVKSTDMITWVEATYEYDLLVPVDMADSITVVMENIPDGYSVEGSSEKAVDLNNISAPIVFKLIKAKELIETKLESKHLDIKINKDGEGGNFVIRNSDNELVYVGVLVGKERSLRIYLEDEETGTYKIYVNVDGIVKTKEIILN